MVEISLVFDSARLKLKLESKLQRTVLTRIHSNVYVSDRHWMGPNFFQVFDLWVLALWYKINDFWSVLRSVSEYNGHSDNGAPLSVILTEGLDRCYLRYPLWCGYGYPTSPLSKRILVTSRIKWNLGRVIENIWSTLLRIILIINFILGITVKISASLMNILLSSQ